MRASLCAATAQPPGAVTHHTATTPLPTCVPQRCPERRRRRSDRVCPRQRGDEAQLKLSARDVVRRQRAGSTRMGGIGSQKENMYFQQPYFVFFCHSYSLCLPSPASVSPHPQHDTAPMAVPGRQLLPNYRPTPTDAPRATDPSPVCRPSSFPRRPPPAPRTARPPSPLKTPPRRAPPRCPR